MIKIINGILGGGKTALAVSYVYSLVPNKVIHKPIVKDVDYQGDYKKVYTNISGFKSDDFYIPVEFLNWNILDKCALVLHLLLQNNLHIQNIDTQINLFFDQVADGIHFDKLECDLDTETAEIFYDDIVNFRFNRVLFSIDEFADYFKDKKDHLDKWFKYSRHLHQDMILIQNDLGDIARCYKNDKTVQNYIQASDAENRFFPFLFKYAYHRKSTQPISGKPQIKNVYIPKWIFSKYESGQKQTAVPVIYKYFALLILLVIFIIYSISKVFSHSDVEDVSPSISLTENFQVQSPAQIENTSLYNSIPPKPKHDKRSQACFKCSNDICLYGDDIYSIERMKATITIYNFKLFYSSSSSIYSEYCYFADTSFFKQPSTSFRQRVLPPKIGGFGLP